jgi:hypothetical protein
VVSETELIKVNVFQKCVTDSVQNQELSTSICKSFFEIGVCECTRSYMMLNCRKVFLSSRERGMVHTGGYNSGIVISAYSVSRKVID